MLSKVTPGLVFAADPAYAKAILAVLPPQTEVVMTQAADAPPRLVTPFDELLQAKPDAGLEEAHAAVGPDTIVKLLFTSGSTKLPKGVINTHRMMCANQQMIRQAMAFLADEPPVLVDWLPWNHTFVGNHNVGITIYNGGTLTILMLVAHNQDATQKQLSQALSVSAPNVTTLLDRLSERELLTRVRNEAVADRSICALPARGPRWGVKCAGSP